MYAVPGIALVPLRLDSCRAARVPGNIELGQTRRGIPTAIGASQNFGVLHDSVKEKTKCLRITIPRNPSAAARAGSGKILLPRPWPGCANWLRPGRKNRASNHPQPDASRSSGTITPPDLAATSQGMKKSALKKQVSAAIQACLDKKAEELSILEMEKGSGAFTDYFVLCSGTNPRQVQAIADEVEMRLKTAGLRPTHVEGYNQAEWVLIDYVDFVVHVFSEKARKFYDLERLWKSARRLEPSDLKSPAGRRSAAIAVREGARKKRRRKTA